MAEATMNTKNNSRSASTHILIKQVFLKLSQNRDPEKISIREICDAAQINRSSFYLHFTDLYALIDEIQEDIMAQIREILLEEFTRKGSSLDRTFTHFFQLLKENQSFFTPYYKHRRLSVRNLDMTQEEPFRSLILDAGRHFGFETEREVRYHSLFFTPGISAIMESG